MFIEEKDNSCPICGESQAVNFTLFFDGFIKVFKCSSCGFIRQYPGPGIPSVSLDYKEKYNLGFADKGNLFKYPWKKRLFLSTISYLEKYSVRQSQLLDVGSGDGHFLHLCEKKGFICTGLEGSSKMAEYANNICKGNILNGNYVLSSFPSNTFDVITLNQVLEHIEDINAIFLAAKCHLKSGGILAVEVPSIRSPQFMLYRMFRIKSLVAPPKGFSKFHINYFSPHTLSAIFKKYNFEIIDIISGRWSDKYHLPHYLGKIVDYFLNLFKIGGILIIGKNSNLKVSERL